MKNKYITKQANVSQNCDRSSGYGWSLMSTESTSDVPKSRISPIKPHQCFNKVACWWFVTVAIASLTNSTMGRHSWTLLHSVSSLRIQAKYWKIESVSVFLMAICQPHSKAAKADNLSIHGWFTLSMYFLQHIMLNMSSLCCLSFYRQYYCFLIHQKVEQEHNLVKDRCWYDVVCAA